MYIWGKRTLKDIPAIPVEIQRVIRTWWDRHREICLWYICLYHVPFRKYILYFIYLDVNPNLHFVTSFWTLFSKKWRFRAVSNMTSRFQGLVISPLRQTLPTTFLIQRGINIGFIAGRSLGTLARKSLCVYEGYLNLIPFTITQWSSVA